MAQPFDASRLELSGEPFPLAERVGSFTAIGKAHFSVAENGVLAYHAHVTEDALPVWLDREGNRLGALGSPGDYGTLTLSPDDQRLAFSRIDPQTGAQDVWLVDLSQGTTSRFTSNPAADFFPVWSPDGNRIVFSSTRVAGGNDLFRKMSSGAGEEELLLRSGATNVATDWSADGRFILYQALDPRTNYDLWALPVEADRKPIVLLQTAFSEGEGRLSPDGRWLAYTSDESGRPEVYVRAFLRPGGSQLISTSGGRQPMWRRKDGKELFYILPDRPG